MAHVIKERKFDSREGSVRGAGGVMDRRTFIVTLDITDAEFTENRYPDPRGIVEIYKVPYGSASPWNAYAKAQHYELGTRIANKTWEVTVIYEVGGAAATPTMEAAWDRWMFSVRGAAGTEQIIEEPNDVLESWGIPGTGRLIGTPRFDKGEPAQPDPSGLTYSATVWYINSDGKVASKSQTLTRTDSTLVRPYTSDVRALTYTQSRLFANFNPASVGSITQYYKQVNRFTYLGADPRHLKFVDFILEQIPHLIGDGSIQLEPGIAYRATVVFLFSAKPFVPLSLVATIRDDLGNEQPVIQQGGDPILNPDGKVVSERWLIKGMNFDTLLSIIQDGVIRSPGAIPTE